VKADWLDSRQRWTYHLSGGHPVGAIAPSPARKLAIATHVPDWAYVDDERYQPTDLVWVGEEHHPEAAEDLLLEAVERQRLHHPDQVAQLARIRLLQLRVELDNLHARLLRCRPQPPPATPRRRYQPKAVPVQPSLNGHRGPWCDLCGYGFPAVQLSRRSRQPLWLCADCVDTPSAALPRSMRKGIRWA
jgi:hypothetical protein